jgi:hypothetical protein
LVTLRYRPSRAVILAGLFCSTFFIGMVGSLATGKDQENPLLGAAIGFVLFGGVLVLLVRTVRKYRREIDAEFIAASDGMSPKKRKPQ